MFWESGRNNYASRVDTARQVSSRWVENATKAKRLSHPVAFRILDDCGSASSFLGAAKGQPADHPRGRAYEVPQAHLFCRSRQNMRRSSDYGRPLPTRMGGDRPYQSHVSELDNGK
jgi:hypothetical protein